MRVVNGQSARSASMQQLPYDALQGFTEHIGQVIDGFFMRA
jgi:hypothetical protein